MNCSEIQEQLSALYDGELSSETREAVAAHVANCNQCALRLAEFASYSKSFRELSQPPVPPTVWTGIVAKLDQDSVATTVVTPATEHGKRLWLTTRRFALAASVLFVLGLGFWMTHQSSHSDHDAEFAMVMDHYLKTLDTDPDAAEQFLLNKFNGQTVEPNDAVRLVGYRPAVASGLPGQYTLASTSVMTMPCCTCVKAVCKRTDGSTLVLFEHDDEKAELLGNRPSSMVTCGDTECCLVDLDSRIAATWKRGSRWFTAVGARDQAEIGELATWFEKKTTYESQRF